MATALIWPLAWELPYAADMALERQERKEERKEEGKEERKKEREKKPIQINSNKTEQEVKNGDYANFSLGHFNFPVKW